MLDCGSNRAFEVIDSRFNDPKQSVMIEYELLAANSTTAVEIFDKYNFSIKQRANVSKYMYCQAPEDYFITSQDMVGKSGVWAHFGSWDFKKSAIWVKVKNMPQKEAI